MRRVILAAVSTVVGLVMLLSFKTRSTTSATLHAGLGTSTTSTTSGTPTTTGPGISAGPATSTTSPSAAASPGTRIVTGAAQDTRYGPVQVQISVTNGQVTAVSALVYPTDTSRDAQINSYAIPQLNQEAMAAKSAKIDMISGATYTSTGYIGSLQSALSQAGL